MLAEFGEFDMGVVSKSAAFEHLAPDALGRLPVFGFAGHLRAEHQRLIGDIAGGELELDIGEQLLRAAAIAGAVEHAPEREKQAVVIGGVGQGQFDAPGGLLDQEVEPDDVIAVVV